MADEPSRTLFTLVLVPLTLLALACGSEAGGGDGGDDDSGGTEADGAGASGATGSSAQGASSSAGTSSAQGGSNSGGAGTGGDEPPPVYEHVVIDFDELEYGTVVTDQYAAQATFSTSPGCQCEAASDAGVAASQPNYLWTYYTCRGGETAPFFVDFSKPVRAVSITLVGVNGTGVPAVARLVLTDGTTHEVEPTGLGDPYAPVVVDLSTDVEATRLEVVDVDDWVGLGIDDLAFDFPMEQ